MLNVLIDSVSTPRRDIDPAALAGKLSLTSAELASLIGVSRNTMATGTASAKLQAALQPLVKILALASDAGALRRVRRGLRGRMENSTLLRQDRFMTLYEDALSNAWTRLSTNRHPSAAKFPPKHRAPAQRRPPTGLIVRQSDIL